MVSKPNPTPLTFTPLLFFIFITTSMAAFSLSYVTMPASSTLSCIFSLVTLLFTLSLFSLTLHLLKITRNIKRTEQKTDPLPQTSIISLQISLSSFSANTHKPHFLALPNSLLLKGALFSPVSRVSSPGSGSSDSSVEKIEYNPCCDIEKKKKKRKKKGKRKQDSYSSEIVVVDGGGGVDNGGGEVGLLFEEYPFTSSSSLIQKKLKEQYDEFVKLHDSKELSMAQVRQFMNCLVEAKKELQHKSECVKRKFTITKALLHKANRSSFDRLQQQICKIELEQKRLQEDANVYNWLQQVVKFSPVYKKMVEIRDSIELKTKSGNLPEAVDRDDEENHMSFEEFLAQEKKDVFWKKYGKLKTGASHPI